jgi:signal transduction histidine kinase
MVVVATWTGAAVTYALQEVSRACLSTSEEDRLRGRVSELERTRAEALSRQTTEMSRIERDLHDGAQARLVALALDLGRAEQKIDDDPAAAKELVGQARDEAQRTLQELRDLVRGVGPQILRDRGVEAALVPLAARSPIPVEIKIDLDERPGERIETTAYFVTSEALANAIKHSGAEKINVNAWRNEDWCYLRVSDNGSGLADEDGEGLRGLRARVEAVDGRLMIDSPAGGPTIIDAWLPFQ